MFSWCLPTRDGADAHGLKGAEEQVGDELGT